MKKLVIYIEQEIDGGSTRTKTEYIGDEELKIEIYEDAFRRAQELINLKKF